LQLEQEYDKDAMVIDKSKDMDHPDRRIEKKRMAGGSKKNPVSWKAAMKRCHCYGFY